MRKTTTIHHQKYPKVKNESLWIDDVYFSICNYGYEAIVFCHMNNRNVTFRYNSTVQKTMLVFKNNGYEYVTELDGVVYPDQWLRANHHIFVPKM